MNPLASNLLPRVRPAAFARALFLALCLIPACAAPIGTATDSHETHAAARATIVGTPFLPTDSAWPERIRLSSGALSFVRDLPTPRTWDFHRTASTHTSLHDDADVDAFRGAVPSRLQSAAVNVGGPGSFYIRFEAAEPQPAQPKTSESDANPMRGGAGATVRRAAPVASRFLRRTIGDRHFVVITGREVVTDSGPRIELERTWFVFYRPLAPSTPRGIALLMPGIFGTPEGVLESLTKALRSDGWCVLRMLAQPSRFTDQVTFGVDPTADLDTPATLIAAVLGDRAAECAYAVQAAFHDLTTTDPTLRPLLRIAIGFSGGAITLPTVVAREPRAYAAAILVGGGANYWLINARSTYADMIDAVRARWRGPNPSTTPTPAQIEALSTAYLAHAPLDSYHTAAALHSKPVLLIQGSADSAVPSDLGDLLWERLFRPDRWIRPGEHLPLFMNLHKDFPAILEWLDARVPRSGRSGAAP